MNNQGVITHFPLKLLFPLPSQPGSEVGAHEALLVFMLTLGFDGPVVSFVFSVNLRLNSRSVKTLIIYP